MLQTRKTELGAKQAKTLSLGEKLSESQKQKTSPKREFSARRPCRHPAKNFGQALQILEKEDFGMDMPRGRPRKNFSLKNFGLISVPCTLGALQKARLRKVHFSGDFMGVFDFLRSACSLRIPQETSKFNKITHLYKHRLLIYLSLQRP